MEDDNTSLVKGMKDGFLLDYYQMANNWLFDATVADNKDAAKRYKKLIKEIDQELRLRGMWKEK